MSQRNEAFAEVEALTRNVEKLDERLEQLGRLAGGSSSASASTVTLNAGGIGVWLAVSACAVSVAVTIVAVVFGALAINDQGRQIGRAQDHLTAIYMMAPHLKPKEEPDVQHDHHHYPAADQAQEGQRNDPEQPR